MKISTLVIICVMMLSHAFMLADAFLAPSQQIVWAGDAVSPLMAKPKKSDEVITKPALAERPVITRKKWGVEVRLLCSCVFLSFAPLNPPNKLYCRLLHSHRLTSLSIGMIPGFTRSVTQGLAVQYMLLWLLFRLF